MSWDELSALFRDTVADALPEKTLGRILDLVAGLDKNSRPRDILALFVASPEWLQQDD
jgi:hypothetical protein